MRCILTLCLLVAACRGDRAASSVEPASVAGSNEPSERRAAVERCAAAFAQVASDQELTDAASIVRDCKDLYRAPACRAALERVPTIEPSDRFATVVVACARAYCPELAAPLPALCTSDPEQAGPDDWKELDARILARELGVAPDSPAIQRVAGFLLRATRSEVRRAKSDDLARPQASIRISLMGGDADATVGIVGGDRWPIPRDPQRADLMPLIASLEKLPNRADVMIVLVAQPDTSHRQMIALMEALRDAGFQRFGLSTSPAP